MATQDVKIRITALDKTRGALGGLANRLGALARPLLSLKTLLAGLLGATGMTLLVRQSLLATDALSKTASKIGTTTEALSALQFAGKLTGVEVNTMNMALQRFSRRASEAASGTGEAKGAIRELGIDARDLVKLPLDEQMLVLADAFQGVKSETDKLRIAFKLFDSEGAALVNTLSQGRGGLAEMLGEAKALGVVMSAEAAAGVEKANDEFLKLNSIFKGILDQTTAALAPALEYIVKSLSDALVSFGDAQKGFAEVGKTIAITLIQGVQQGANGIVNILNKVIESVNVANAYIARFSLKGDERAVRSAEEQIELLNKQEAAFKKYTENRYKEGFELTKNEYRLFTRAQKAGLDSEEDYAQRRLQLQETLAQKIAVLKAGMAAVEGKSGIPQIEKILGFTQEELDALFETILGKVGSFNLKLGEAPKIADGNIANKYLESLEQLNRQLPQSEDLVTKFANNTMNAFTTGFTNAITGAENFADAIKSMAKSVVDDLIRMAVQYYITQEIFGAIVKAFPGGGGTTTAPSPQPPARSTGPIFNGGGFTGYGARAGGVDGKGGFPAILHPNETVLDHTKGQGQGVTIVQNINVTTGVQQTVRAEIANLLPQISNAAKAAVADSRMRGGGFSKAMVGA